MSIVYVFADKGLAGACKIGTSATLEGRYRQARCHTPRGIQGNAFFDLASTRSARLAESAAKRALATMRRSGDATEWFNLAPAEAAGLMSKLLEFASARRLDPDLLKLKSSDLLYDDWREARAQYSAYKWRLFLFEEQNDERRLKLSYGALYETAYRYVFTYNPFPVRLVAGLEDPAAPERQADENTAVNERVASAWKSLQAQVGSTTAQEVGWLKPGLTAGRVAGLLREHGFCAFDLRRPKPPGALVREPSMNPPIPIGASLPMARVSPSPEVYEP